MGRVTRSAARSRTSWVAAAILAMLAVSVVAYAAARLLQGGYLDPGMTGASEADLVTMINLAQTIDGQTVTLNYAYADSNRISLEYAVSGEAPEGTTYQFVGETLTDSAGNPFESMFGGGGGGGGGSATDAGTPATVSYSMVQQASYDASGVGRDVDELKLRLQVSLQKFVADVPETTLGPFVYDFTIPFIQGQIVEPRIHVTANGQSILLERLMIAPSFTRALVCFDPLPEKNYAAVLNLTVNGEAILTDELASLAPASSAQMDGCYDLQINQSLYQRSGDWSLSIDSLVAYYPASLAVGDDGTKVDYSFDGAPETLALIRAELQPALTQYGVALSDEGGSLKFSVRHDSGIDLDAIQALATDASREETPGPWVFDFTLPASS